MTEFLLDPLRLSLLLAGVVVVGGIYVYSRAASRRSRRQPPSTEALLAAEKKIYDALYKDPELNGGDDVKLLTPVHEPVAEASTAHRRVPSAQVEAPVERRFIVLNVVAAEGQSFSGEALAPALQECGLQFGKHRIYHYQVAANDKHVTLFSVANMVEPGTLDIAGTQEFCTPGLSFFMRVPGPVDSGAAFAKMLVATESIAERLGGQVRDEQIQPLTAQTIEQIRAEIAAQASAQRRAATV